MQFSFRRFFLVLSVLTLTLPCAQQSVRADVGVQPVLPGGSDLKPGEETPIQMAAEVVTMNVRAATQADNAIVALNPKAYGYADNPWFRGVAEVEAVFTMRNPTTDTISLTAWFPLASALENADWNFNPDETVPRIVGFTASANGVPLEITTSELPNPKGEDKPDLPWASFPMTFPAGQDTVIKVNYTLPLQPAIKSAEMALYYVFQTGAGWAGTIGKAELIVNLPYPASTATLSGIDTEHFSLPYMSVNRKAVSLPAGVSFNGNQARWTWTDFEPGPDDDFAIWVMNPADWTRIAAGRAAVSANPQDGQAWLDLGNEYLTLSYGYMLSSKTFTYSYAPLAAKAFQNAARLLPENPAPHAALAALALAPYMANRDAPADVMKTVQDEVKTAKELNEKNPVQVKESGYSATFIEGMDEILSLYAYNSATATVEAATWAVIDATQTAVATRDFATITAAAVYRETFMACWPTAGEDCYHTPSATPPRPSNTPTLAPTRTATPPVPTAMPTPAVESGAPVAIAAVFVLLGLAGAGLWALSRWKKRTP